MGLDGRAALFGRLLGGMAAAGGAAAVDGAELVVEAIPSPRQIAPGCKDELAV